MRGYNTLSPSARDRLERVLRTDDPTDEVGAAWGIKEQLRLTLRSTTIAQARYLRRVFDLYVLAAQLPEADRLKKTIDSWWPEIEAFIDTRATNARTEAANVTIKHIKRTGRGYRSHANYRSRIMLHNAARSAA
ncbi:transposase [Nocardioides faecalis]|uniref:transposase n=1 Tax=Nocardioides faecalis TaxID=2803858 RepID=UPI0035582C55